MERPARFATAFPKLIDSVTAVGGRAINFIDGLGAENERQALSVQDGKHLAHSNLCVERKISAPHCGVERFLDRWRLNQKRRRGAHAKILCGHLAPVLLVHCFNALHLACPVSGCEGERRVVR